MVLTETRITDLTFPPHTANAIAVLNRRYLVKDPETDEVCEEPNDMYWRVAGDLAQAEAVFGATAEDILEVQYRFFRLMRSGDFLPNSPTLMNAGRDLQQLSACFVLPIEDDLDDIFRKVHQTAMIHKSGGGTGFSFSRLRPEGDKVRSTGGVASGPSSFIGAFDAATDVVKQGGTRRGANMGVLSVRHPDIMEFIDIKRDGVTLQNFNISVTVDDHFMERLAQDGDYDLINPRTGEVADTVPARDVWDAIVDGAWHTGDPGVLFIDRINRHNPNPQLGDVESTNPCGEATLLPFESCNLGSLNLLNMLRPVANSSQALPVYEIDEEKLRATVADAVHLLDNVIERNNFPLAEIEERTRATRRIGVGVMGFADLAIALRVPYDSEEGLELAENVMALVDDAVVTASRDLARERSPFPEFGNSRYAENGEPPRRNSAPTTIAPTGTISRIAGVSSGIEPLFALCYTSKIMDGTRLPEIYDAFRREAEARGFLTDELMDQLAEYGYLHDDMDVPEDVRRLYRTSHQIAPEWHVRMQAAFQKHCESAVSKTVNLPHEAEPEDIDRVYRMAYELGCKGVTVFRDGSKTEQVLNIGLDTAEPESAAPAPFLHPESRPDVLPGCSFAIETGHGRGYFTVNWDRQGNIREVFADVGKSGACDGAMVNALTRMVSISLRSGVDPQVVVQQLRDHRCCPIWWNGVQVQSVPDAIGLALTYAMEMLKGDEPPSTAAVLDLPLHRVGQVRGSLNGNGSGNGTANGSVNLNGNGRSEARLPGITCPVCSAQAAAEEGCYKCYSCDWSNCG